MEKKPFYPERPGPRKLLFSMAQTAALQASKLNGDFRGFTRV
jgi:hypothetical protein